MEDFLDLVEYITPGMLWVVFLMVVLFAGGIAFALSYHWKEYTLDVHRSSKMFKGYLIVIGFFVLAMILAIILYSTA